MRGLQEIRRKLTAWYDGAARELPWRLVGDPYRILVSEVMLQQTRVAAALPFYERFIDRFPDAESLAQASEEDLLAGWGGLGYYRRAWNLQKAARLIVEFGGFPQDYEAIRKLPGVGDYTAAAVASIAFNLPCAAVDGNVLRVLSRLTDEAEDIGSSRARKRLRGVAEKLLDREQPGRFNQAMMELGATVCLPKAPLCLFCPVSAHCRARQLGVENERPVRTRRASPVHEKKTLLLVERGGSLLLWKRKAGTRLGGFWELPEAGQIPGARLGKKLGEFRHSIMDCRYLFTLVAAQVATAPRGFSWVSRGTLGRIPLSTTTRKALACS